ncbi:hypothetical protein ACQJBY_027720 [Aegilops geniculata]
MSTRMKVEGRSGEKDVSLLVARKRLYRILYYAALKPCRRLIPGDTLASFIYVPFEVMNQRMQLHGSSKSWGLNATEGNVSQSPGTHVWVLLPPFLNISPFKDLNMDYMQMYIDIFWHVDSLILLRI